MNNEREVKQGEFYKHFKNKIYQIVTVATHSETREKMVVYQALYGDFQTYVRPYNMFVSEVDHEKYPEIKQKYRFAKYDVNSGSIIKVDASIDKKVFEHSNTVSTNQIDQVLHEPISIENIEEGQISPLLLEFLDCDTYEAKLNKFLMMKDKADERLLNDIAMSLDITIESEKLQNKYDEIKTCLLTFVHFEDNRMR